MLAKANNQGGGRGKMRTKRAGFVTKIVVLALLIYMATALLNLQGRIRATELEGQALMSLVTAQTQKNADLAAAVANPNDPERVRDIARDKLDMVAPGEKVFVITN